MKFALPLLVLLAQARAAGPQPDTRVSFGDILEPNSLITGLTLPNYDKNLRLTSVLRAKTVILVTKDVLDGTRINIRAYDPEKNAAKSVVDLARARYDTVTGRITGTGTVRMVSPEMTLTATGLFYSMPATEGFLTGPVDVRIAPQTDSKPATTTSVNPKTASIAAALIGVAAGQTPPAPPPPPATPPAAVAETDPAEALARTTANQAELRAALEASAKANQSAMDYLKKENLLSAASGTPAKPSDTVEFKPSADDMIVKCDGGMYLNREKRILVFLKNVRVNSPDFGMKGANELKIFFAAPDKPANQADPGETPAGDNTELGQKLQAGGFTGGMGKIERIMASGALYFVEGKPKPGEAPIEAGGAIFTYRANDKTATLAGGKPWVRRSKDAINRALEDNQYITIRDGVATFSPGPTELILSGDLLKKQGGGSPTGGSR